ncbi:MAG: glycerol-3-phosphate acyltransferase [Acidimicrobiia bacterium]
MIVLAGVVGYLIGSLPTATWLGRIWGVDLRREGTGNPGANNARRLGGTTLALLILLIEITKGLSAVVVGLLVAEQAGAVVAGIAAVMGNVFNLWLGFHGGKGLGISGGVLLGLWPGMFPVVVVVLALASALTRSTGIGTLATIGVLGIAALAWGRFGISNPWGVDEPTMLLVVIASIAVIIGPKHWRDARRRLSSPAAR